MEICSGRIFLRQWRKQDLDGLARMNADARVMAFFPATLNHEQSEAMLSSFMRLMDQRGWGIWVLEIPGVTDFAGFVGLHETEHDLPFCPCTEIVWRLDAEYWGRGYATEAARAALDFGFTTLGLEEIVAFTSVGNRRSQRVMQRLGMSCDERGFEHPAVEIGSPLRAHVLYRIARPYNTDQKQGPVI